MTANTQRVPGTFGLVTGLAAPWSWHDQTPAKLHTPSMGGGQQRDVRPDNVIGAPPVTTLGPRRPGQQHSERQPSGEHEPSHGLQILRDPERRPNRVRATYRRRALGPGQQFAALGRGGFQMGPNEPPPMLALPAGRPNVPLLPPGGAARALPIGAAGKASASQFKTLFSVAEEV